MRHEFPGTAIAMQDNMSLSRRRLEDGVNRRLPRRGSAQEI